MVIFKMSRVSGHFLDYKGDLKGPLASSCSLSKEMPGMRIAFSVEMMPFKLFILR